MHGSRTYVDQQGSQWPHDGQSSVAWRVSAYAVAVRDDAILLIEPVWASCWELPGGGVEPTTQETLAEGASRECWEETGYRFTPEEEPSFVAEMFFANDSPTRYYHSLLFAVRGSVANHPDPDWPGDPHEVSVVRWVPLASLTSDAVHQPHWDALRRFALV